MRQVRVRLDIPAGPLNGYVRDVSADEFPAIQGCSQQRVNAIGATPNVQTCTKPSVQSYICVLSTQTYLFVYSVPEAKLE